MANDELVGYADVGLVSKVILERLHVAKNLRLAGHTLRSLRIESYLEPAVNELVLTLQAELLGLKRQEETKVVRFFVPFTWWDHFKEEIFPVWARRQWPPQYKALTEEVTMKVYECDPELPRVFPESHHSIFLPVLTSQRGEEAE